MILNTCHGQWNRGQISTKLGTKHVIYQKLAMQKKDVYANRIKSAIFGM